jgi:hypothetical protein
MRLAQAAKAEPVVHNEQLRATFVDVSACLESEHIANYLDIPRHRDPRDTSLSHGQSQGSF